MREYLVKLILFLLFVGVVQIIIVPRPRKLVDLEQFAAAGTDILYFGDSVVRLVDDHDKDTDSLAEMFSREISDYSVGDMSHVAYHSGIYEAYVAHTVAIQYQPKLIIIPINLRSFSPEWDKKPAYQFVEEQLFMEKPKILSSFYTFLTALGYEWDVKDPVISMEQYEATAVYFGQEQVGIVADFDNPSYEIYSDEHLREELIFHYLYQLAGDERKLKSLEQIAAMGQEAGIPILFYVTPIDYQTGEQFFPQQFEPQIQRNIDLIETRLAEYEVGWLDLSFALPSDAFSYELYPNEHLNEKGRLFVSSAVVEKVEEMLGR